MSEIERLAIQARDLAGGIKMLATTRAQGSIDETYQACCAAIEALAAAKVAGASDEIHQATGHLLARIHRDGGHYVQEHGMLKALADAENIVAGASSAEPVAWVNKSTLASAAISREQGHFDTWSDEKTPYHDTPLYAAPVPSAESGAEPVGEAGSMPGTSGFTMACFKAADVPVGTKLYANKYTIPPYSKGTKP